MNFDTLLDGRVSVAIGSNFEIGRMNYTVTNVTIDRKGIMVELKCIDYDTRFQSVVRVAKDFKAVEAVKAVEPKEVKVEEAENQPELPLVQEAPKAPVIKRGGKRR